MPPKKSKADLEETSHKSFDTRKESPQLIRMQNT